VVAFLLLAASGADLDALMAPILPKPEEEKWLSIPWRTDLNTARADAARDGKPMFFWIMNGDPMGCT
jgi:hypothetical protein